MRRVLTGDFTLGVDLLVAPFEPVFRSDEPNVMTWLACHWAMKALNSGPLKWKPWSVMMHGRSCG